MSKNRCPVFIGIQSNVLLILIILCLTAAASNQTDVVVAVVDTSGSMALIAPELKRAIKGFVSNLPPQTRFSLVSFDVFSNVQAVRQLGTPEALMEMNAAIDALQFTGAKTNLDEGIKGAQAALWQNMQKKATQNAVVLLFSDGISDPSEEKAVVDLTHLAKDVFPTESGTGVYLIGLSEYSVKRPTPSAYHTDANITQLGISEKQLATVLQSIQREGSDLEAVVTAQSSLVQETVMSQSTADSKTGDLPKTPLQSVDEKQVRQDSTRPLSGQWVLFGLIPLASLCGYFIGRKKGVSHSLEVAIASPEPMDNAVRSDTLFSENNECVIQLHSGSSVTVGNDDFLEHWIPGLPGTWSLSYQQGQVTLKKEDTHVKKVFDYQSWE